MEEVEFKFNTVEVQIILEGLRELPYKKSNATIVKVYKQYEEYQQKQEEAAREKASTEE